MTHIIQNFTHAEKIVIRAFDFEDAEAWALLSDHVDLMEIDTEPELTKTFTFDDGSRLVIVGIHYTALPAETGVMH